ncbi:hypothetical protein AVEN_212802-1 [Araneus ventricosus]|uniref:Uncharacterized protein n=1 Tax=Araneus ventricosus TaxID=182803 RepID=A0A4Y2KZL7_ARAVE|nr:hypothetical protein AVEN_212802-1 [Araneus ventricosus]
MFTDISISETDHQFQCPQGPACPPNIHARDNPSFSVSGAQHVHRDIPCQRQIIHFQCLRGPSTCSPNIPFQRQIISFSVSGPSHMLTEHSIPETRSQFRVSQGPSHCPPDIPMPRQIIPVSVSQGPSHVHQTFHARDRSSNFSVSGPHHMFTEHSITETVISFRVVSGPVHSTDIHARDRSKFSVSGTQFHQNIPFPETDNPVSVSLRGRH